MISIATWSDAADTRSLDHAPTGQSLRIRSILFDSVRSQCAEVGLREGDVIRIDAATTSHLRVHGPAGDPVELPRDAARFIQAVPERLQSYPSSSRLA
ncbi:MAG: hypothetical protein ACRELD_14340 [Longimicrobiales bacterium]